MLAATSWVALLLGGPASIAQQAPPAAPTRLDSLLARGRVVYGTARGQVERFRRLPTVQRLALPALLIGSGALLRHEVEVFDLEIEADESVRAGAREHLSWVRTHVDDQLRHVPAYATLGLSLAGVKGQHGTVEQAVLFGLIYHLNNGLTSNLKRLTRVERPYGNDFSSFPSSHTSAAFAAARFMHKEYGSQSVWYSVGAYSVATATGALRIAKDNHWLSDVLAGAGVGVLSTELVYWAYPNLRRTATSLWHRSGNHPDARTATLLMPFYNQGALGATVVLSFR
ncbi:phosphatase PAP2 family protein [Hymenobacter norwichensis]|uniref:phosphatase PAP2 family protein n=1 Tax=Hymenobacter norwichensis TaxID=223903 RepID=UPI0003B53181|nr:phosphatase PAP2 family protein [Hymenobacter norwichensis]